MTLTQRFLYYMEKAASEKWTASERTLYSVLMRKWNSVGMDEFQLTDEEIMYETSMSGKTLRRARKELEIAGHIKVKIEIGRKATVYRFDDEK